MTHSVDWSLYLVTDPNFVPAHELPKLVTQAVEGGVTVVQLRDKHASDDDFGTQAEQLREKLIDIPLFVNDRFTIARELGLHLHIGQTDMPYVAARRMLPPQLMIGLTIENAQQWSDCVKECTSQNVKLPDVIGLGPVVDTPTKPDAPTACGVTGVAKLATMAQHHGVPSVAIGGVYEGNAAALAGTDVSGLCVVSAIMGASDPKKAAQKLRNIFGANREQYS